MDHVFISYVHENMVTVSRLCRGLESHGIKVWKDQQDLGPGVRWKQAIRKAIREGAFFLACFSKEYYKRDQTYMNEELIIAIEELRQRPADRVWFIPIKLDECEVPDRYTGAGETLRDFQYADLSKDWGEGFQNILKAIQPESEELVGIEAVLYHQIIRKRLKVIEVLQNCIKENEPEVRIQEHLYENLWLLDPSWDKTVETPLMERNVKTEFTSLDANLSLKEQRARFDIKYKKTSGKHIIIELKRANRKLDDYQLLAQTDKYRTALEKLIQAAGQHEPVEVVCIVGKPLRQWTTPARQEESKRTLAMRNVRVVLYDELIEYAYRSYQEFLDANEKAKRIYQFVKHNDNFIT